MTMHPHISILQSLAFSSDGRYLASGSVDDTIKLHYAPLLADLPAQK
jgi:hypothetical protein